MGFLSSLKNKFGGGVEEGGSHPQENATFSNSFLADEKKSVPVTEVEPTPYLPQTPEQRQAAAIAAGKHDRATVGPTPNEGNGAVQQPPNSAGRGRF